MHRLPYGRWTNEGLEVSVSSDDPMIFGATVDGELDAICAVFGQEVASRMANASVSACTSQVDSLDADGFARLLIRTFTRT
jgi:adenosine deaminase